jgi:hypothetical protein
LPKKKKNDIISDIISLIIYLEGRKEGRDLDVFKIFVSPPPTSPLQVSEVRMELMHISSTPVWSEGSLDYLPTQIEWSEGNLLW